MKAQAHDLSLVSVIIPCYKQAHYLDQAIRSVLAQTYGRYEIIVVDDGSPDNTSVVAARYADVRCIRQPNLGLSAARNTGLRASKGEYVVFLDADDRLLPEALETGVKSLRAFPRCALVYGFCELIDHKGAPLPTPPQTVVKQNSYRALLEGNYIWTPGAAMFRRSIFSQLIGFDESLIMGCEDWDVYLRVAKASSIHCHGTVTLQYRKHRASMSSNKYRMFLAINEIYRKHLREVKDDPELQKLCRSKIAPLYRFMLQGRLINRITMALRLRTRWRAMKSSLQSMRESP